MKGVNNKQIKDPLSNKWQGVHEKLEQDISINSGKSAGSLKGLDLHNLELIKDPKEAGTSLEFLICTLSIKFNLKIPQVLFRKQICI